MTVSALVWPPSIGSPSQARFEVLSATGHMPQMEAPDLVLREI